MSDAPHNLVDQLRAWSGACLTPEHAASAGPRVTDLLRTAADEIEWLREERQTLGNDLSHAMVRFGNLWSWIDRRPDDEDESPALLAACAKRDSILAALRRGDFEEAIDRCAG